MGHSYKNQYMTLIKIANFKLKLKKSILIRHNPYLTTTISKLSNFDNDSNENGSF